jgi:diguanylate cyclase (GGDEF)-like protein
MLAFFERLSQHAPTSSDGPLTIIYFDLVNLSDMNRSGGRDTGDQALRWLALALQDELALEGCFRLRGDEFAAVLQGCTPETAEALATKVQDRFMRLTQGQTTIQLEPHPIHIVVLHIEAPGEMQVADVVIDMETVMQQLKREDQTFLAAHYPIDANVNLRETVSSLILRMLELGGMLDMALTQAETDPLTGLPNMRAMQRMLGESVVQAGERETPFAVLLVDGDNLRQFNKISYQAGDEMLQQLANLLGSGLRQQDKLARWRLGDEFLILLPGAGTQEAQGVAQRLVETIAHAEWQLPVTISIGIALFPQHGRDADTLEDAVEAALTQAKEQGKNQAVLYHRDDEEVAA